MNQQKPRVVPTSNYKPPIFLCIILTNLFLLPQNSLSLLDPRYEDCIKPVYCGSQKITYPFFIRRNGDYRKKQYSCGYPGYEVSCENNQTLIIQLSQDDYVVRRIFYPNQSIQLVNSAFINKTDFVCKTPVHNLSVYDGRFRFAPHTQVLHLLWNCSNGDPGDLRIDRNRVTVVSCLNVNKFNESNDGKTDQCGTVTDVHYDGSVGEKDAPTDGLLERGILLQWSANNCSACDLSGGRCGYNKTISRFQCFCPDRPRPNRCHDRKPSKYVNHPLHTSRHAQLYSIHDLSTYKKLIGFLLGRHRK